MKQMEKNINTKYGTATVETDSDRNYLIVQLSFKATALIQKIGCNEVNRFKQIIWLMSKCGIDEKEAIESFSDTPLFKTYLNKTDEIKVLPKILTETFNIVETAITDKTESENEKLYDEIQEKIKAFEKTANRFAKATEVETAINNMDITFKQKAFLFKKLLSKETEAVLSF